MTAGPIIQYNAMVVYTIYKLPTRGLEILTSDDGRSSTITDAKVRSEAHSTYQIKKDRRPIQALSVGN